jgi:hypothetical protein
MKALKTASLILFFLALVSFVVYFFILPAVLEKKDLDEDADPNYDKRQTELDYSAPSSSVGMKDTTFVRILDSSFSNLFLPKRCNWRFDPIVSGWIQFLMYDGTISEIYKDGQVNCDFGDKVPKATRGEGVFLFTVTVRIAL